VKKVKTTFCTFRFRLPFTLWHTHVSEKSREEAGPEKKCAADKTINRAGATPLFGLSAAQKVLGVAPALGTVACPQFCPSRRESFRSRMPKEQT
jgi:hypothetical protein